MGVSADHNRVSGLVIDAAYTVHRALGPGLLESVYEQCLAYELTTRGVRMACQVALPIVYKELQIDGGLRIDLVVEGLVVVELKAVERLLPIHEAQLLTYLKLSGQRLGLLINFNVPTLKEGLRRMVLWEVAALGLCLCASVVQACRPLAPFVPQSRDGTWRPCVD